MNKLIRIFFIIVIITVFLVAFSPSYNSLNIDNLAYVVGLGIDFGKNEKYKISFQFSSGKSSESSSNKETSETSNNQNSSTTNTVEASSIDSAINLMNSYLAKKINLSHCKIIVFSEEVAYKGISDEIYTLTNNSEIRPSASIIISKNSSEDYLKGSSPILEDMISKYYEIFPHSSKYTGYIYKSTLGDFYSNLVSLDSESYAILGGITNNSSSKSLENLKSSNTQINRF